jgi:hypothetical protein
MPQFEATPIKNWTQTFVAAVTYYSASLCACALEHGGVPDAACPLCYLGFVYAEGVAAEAVRMRVSIRHWPAELATSMQGGASLTIPALLRSGAANPAFKYVHRGDVFVFNQFPQRDTDVLKRGTRDSLWAFQVSEIVLVRDEDGVLYVEGTNFTLVGTTITWIAGKGPAVGKAYVTEFVAPSQYIIMQTDPVHRGGDDTGVSLPKSVLAVMRVYQASAKTHPLSTMLRELE